jgi:hypothetical protein
MKVEVKYIILKSLTIDSPSEDGSDIIRTLHRKMAQAVKRQKAKGGMLMTVKTDDNKFLVDLSDVKMRQIADFVDS